MLAHAGNGPNASPAPAGGWFGLLGRLRYGQPIVVVSGLPRSGTSMAMRMLAAGGLPILSDGVRTADPCNPHGYFEFEPVKNLDRPNGDRWLRAARGRGVKIISQLLTYLPEDHRYRVIFMERDLEEVVMSQNQMLAARGQAVDVGDDTRLRAAYLQHLRDVKRFMDSRTCFTSLSVRYDDVIKEPLKEATRMATFLGGRLDVAKMASMADPSLYRNRR